MERRDLYEDDLTEERYPSPVRRDITAATETLDPDIPDETIRRVIPSTAQLDPDEDDDDDDDDDDLDDEDDDDDDS